MENADHLGRNVLRHPLEIIVAGLGARHLHAVDARLQDSFEPGDLRIEVGHARLAYQSSDDSLPRSGRRYVREAGLANRQGDRLG